MVKYICEITILQIYSIFWCCILQV